MHTLFIVLPMTIIMALVSLARNYGFGDGWHLMFLRAWVVMFPVAYIAVLFIVPAAKKVTDKLPWKE
jgi:hypothetical protein